MGAGELLEAEHEDDMPASGEDDPGGLSPRGLPAWSAEPLEPEHHIRQHTLADVSIRQRTSAYVSIRERTVGRACATAVEAAVGVALAAAAV